ncbi:hypothetical protein BD311DRAFT_761707 [Dichomitus squalens]|uniref:Uncharacterized protein n=1 Tax=Dichomitus squalens TaxID=114155 RepID=A0A4Q9MLH8_9APHY|nr:hypothetical protein BD311DRAFT_761707 [Dichomitus squalens]
MCRCVGGGERKAGGEEGIRDVTVQDVNKVVLSPSKGVVLKAQGLSAGRVSSSGPVFKRTRSLMKRTDRTLTQQVAIWSRSREKRCPRSPSMYGILPIVSRASQQLTPWPRQHIRRTPTIQRVHVFANQYMQPKRGQSSQWTPAFAQISCPTGVHEPQLAHGAVPMCVSCKKCAKKVASDCCDH